MSLMIVMMLISTGFAVQEIELNSKKENLGFHGNLRQTDIEQVHVALDLVRTVETPNRVRAKFRLVTPQRVCVRTRQVYNPSLCRVYRRPPRRGGRYPRPPRGGRGRPYYPGDFGYPGACYETVCAAWEVQELGQDFTLKLRFKGLRSLEEGEREVIGLNVVKTGKASVRYEAFSDQGYDVDVNGKRITVTD